jgi:hypothetical protein
MNTYPKYDEGRECPKCEGKGVSEKYCLAVEAIQRTCTNCGFWWYVKCKDACSRSQVCVDDIVRGAISDGVIAGMCGMGRLEDSCKKLAEHVELKKDQQLRSLAYQRNDKTYLVFFCESASGYRDYAAVWEVVDRTGHPNFPRYVWVGWKELKPKGIT